MTVSRETFRVEAEIWLQGHWTETGDAWFSDLADNCIREFDVQISEGVEQTYTALSMRGGQPEMVFSVPGWVIVDRVQGMVAAPTRRGLPVLSAVFPAEECFMSEGTMHIPDVYFGVVERKDDDG